MLELVWGHPKTNKKKKDFFKGKSKLLQKIEHGDFDISPYAKLADRELENMRKAQELAKEQWKGSLDSLAYELKLIEQKHYKRYNKLRESYHNEEDRLLTNLRLELYKEFKVDCWEEVVKIIDSEDLVQFYHAYRILAQSKSINK